MSESQSNFDLRNWFDRIKLALTREPQDRQALIEILRNSENRNLLDPDVLIMIEGAMHVSDMRVNEIMVPRVQMIILSVGLPIGIMSSWVYPPSGSMASQ